ncbi:hypothetical protein CSH63_26950 [Micromonospora tulbaghiae]|uniref:SMI1/KNR4 family protein n=1 Tax=Micromonospora tulbaghiae TaxID=479978 RepID=A0A386WSS5_9ACTN|nr:hypothetical protein [Micromonospora tulbaghiae]AYF31013.1 hypothetical protein CSH63_26950 [Micromonospora tulbaghiae]
MNVVVTVVRLLIAGVGGGVATGRVCFVEPGFDLDRALAGGVGDADGAWRFIRQFADSCAGPIVAGDGCDDDELRSSEARLGFPLPASLRQAYALMGRRDDLTRSAR